MIKYVLLLLGFTGPKEYPKMIENEIEQFYHVEIAEIRRVDPADELIEPSRNRFKADKVLSYFQRELNSKPFIILTSKDLAMSKKGNYDWGILGYSFVGQKVAVVSNNRIKTKSLLIKVALHEFGHSMGLPHCTSKQACLMKDAKGKGKTIEKQGKRLCISCKNLLGKKKASPKKLFGFF